MSKEAWSDSISEKEGEVKAFKVNTIKFNCMKVVYRLFRFSLEAVLSHEGNCFSSTPIYHGFDTKNAYVTLPHSMPDMLNTIRKSAVI